MVVADECFRSSDSIGKVILRRCPQYDRDLSNLHELLVTGHLASLAAAAAVVMACIVRGQRICIKRELA